MKVFYTASMRGQKEFKKHYEKIYHTIEELGYTQLDDELIQGESNTYYDILAKQGRKAYMDLYKRTMRLLHEADICIFECSLHSLSIGFIIEKSLNLNKPTIVLYHKDNLPHLLMGVDEEKLLLRNYTDQNIKKVLKETLRAARERKDKRFNFFITPKLLHYLVKISKEQGITKSKFIRSLIFDYMKKNPLEKNNI